jgi:uncharacterized protein (TIGR03083 family)
MDDTDLRGLDPYDLMVSESDRLYRYFSSLDGPAWDEPSRCEGWSVRDVLAHLASTEDYKRACLDGTVKQFIDSITARGATDLATMNDIAIHDFDGTSTSEILEAWRGAATTNHEDFRARDGGNVDTSVGDYPARWQAFHLAFELATHADDVHVPQTADEASNRNAWQAKFGRFALKEAKPDVTVEGGDGHTHVKAENVDIDLTDDQFVQALAARLPDDSPLDATARAVLSITP